LPANALLPQVDISATQIERDNAVIAAEAEGDEGDSFEERPRTQYMNEKGYFTQTKPQPRPAVSAASSRDLLAGSSALFDFVPAEVPEPELSSTQRDTSEGELAGDSTTQQSESPRRQRSPSSTESGDDEAEIDPGQESRPADAFSRLMAADQRHLTKHQKQAKARIRSNLVDEQADESDEDNWMTGGQTKEDDDEEDEDLDAFLPGLVNDEEVSEEERKRQDALVAAKNRYAPMSGDLS
jgi:mediator of replication checkpoint protein 1